ncbi:hypothetical protein BHM03_00036929 [Ensete ventricosum]|nr:hypothetical protein BHM03_00036929 [Ensete ventricosum]
MLANHRNALMHATSLDGSVTRGLSRDRKKRSPCFLETELACHNPRVLRSWLCPDDVAGTRPAPRCSQLSWPRFPRSLSVSGLRSLYKPRLAFLLAISIGGTLQTLLSSSPCIKKKKKKKKKSERY